MAKNNNYVKLHFARPNIGIFLLVVILIYFIVSFFIYLSKDRILIYEVNAGELVSDNTFSGVIIFDEEVVRAQTSGYVNYYMSEKDRAGVNSLICSIDETGTVYSALAASHDENNMSTATMNMVGRRLMNYSKSRNDLSFYQSYKTMEEVLNIINEYNSNYMVSSLKEMLENGNNFVSLIKPESSALVSFYTDSLTGLTLNSINSGVFDRDNYVRNSLKNRSLVGVGEPLYRRFNSEQWQIVFPMTQNQAAAYAQVNTVRVNFISENVTTTASLSFMKIDETNYGILTLNKYLVNFIDTRFVDFELSLSNASGLKIPISSVCEKEFYTIPVEYGYVNENDGKTTGFLLLTYDVAGNKIRKFVEATYYGNENGYYYVNKDVFDIGDCVVMPPSEDEISYNDTTYIVGTVGSLKGTYCVNRGYCMFRKVEVLDRNDEYYIVERNTTYGLSIYDHIVLNADLVEENQIIY